MKSFINKLTVLQWVSPLGPTLANIFLGYHEKRRWLDNCPLTFKPVLYRRCIDDTFLLFRHESHIQNFLNYLNSLHQSIEFTCETENKCRLNFFGHNYSQKY